MMDDRAYLAQALCDGLRSDGIPFCVLGDSRRFPEELGETLQIAVTRAALPELPRSVSRFCRDFDLQLVQVLREEPSAYRFVAAWSDDLGRPRFIVADLCSDFYLDGRLFLHAHELLARRRAPVEDSGLARSFAAPAPDVQFIHHLLGRLHAGELTDRDGEFLAYLWQEDTPGVLEQIRRFWPAKEDGRRIVAAARHNDWTAVRAEGARLLRALRPRRRGGQLIARAARLARHIMEPPGALIAFVGPDGLARNTVLQRAVRDLAPAFPSGLRAQESPDPRAWRGRRPDLWVLLDVPGPPAERLDETISVDASRPLPAIVASVERGILQWLECRVEHRYPRACVGENPPAARFLQWACRSRVPALAAAANWMLGCAVRCRIRSPILMPEPSGIFIDRGARIGRRVTILHQVTLGWKHPAEPGAPVIEDNVYIGAGAKVLGRVRVGRGATIGANAVVTRDVPSHCTVVGANRILGRTEEHVVEERRAGRNAVVNM